MWTTVPTGLAVDFFIKTDKRAKRTFQEQRATHVKHVTGLRNFDIL